MEQFNITFSTDIRGSVQSIKNSYIRHAKIEKKLLIKNSFFWAGIKTFLKPKLVVFHESFFIKISCLFVRKTVNKILPIQVPAMQSAISKQNTKYLSSLILLAQS